MDQPNAGASPRAGAGEDGESMASDPPKHVEVGIAALNISEPDLVMSPIAIPSGEIRNKLSASANYAPSALAEMDQSCSLSGSPKIPLRVFKEDQFLHDLLLDDATKALRVLDVSNLLYYDSPLLFTYMPLILSGLEYLAEVTMDPSIMNRTLEVLQTRLCESRPLKFRFMNFAQVGKHPENWSFRNFFSSDCYESTELDLRRMRERHSTSGIGEYLMSSNANIEESMALLNFNVDELLTDDSKLKRYFTVRFLNKETGIIGKTHVVGVKKIPNSYSERAVVLYLSATLFIKRPAAQLLGQRMVDRGLLKKASVFPKKTFGDGKNIYVTVVDPSMNPNDFRSGLEGQMSGRSKLSASTAGVIGVKGSEKGESTETAIPEDSSKTETQKLRESVAMVEGITEAGGDLNAVPHVAEPRKEMSAELMFSPKSGGDNLAQLSASDSNFEPFSIVQVPLSPSVEPASLADDLDFSDVDIGIQSTDPSHRVQFKLLIKVDLLDLQTYDFFTKGVFARPLEEGSNFGYQTVFHPFILNTKRPSDEDTALLSAKPNTDSLSAKPMSSVPSVSSSRNANFMLEATNNGGVVGSRVVVTKVFSSIARPGILRFQTLPEHSEVFLAKSASEQFIDFLPDLLVKKGDDLLRDMSVEIMFRIFNYVWKTDQKRFPDSSKVPFSYVYEVLPTGHKEGLMEVMTGVKALNSYNWEDWASQNEHKPEVLRSMTASAAGSFVAAYVLGVNDRHWDNIMIKDSSIMLHIDFGYVLGLVPPINGPRFSVSPDMEKAFRKVGIWDDFVDMCGEAFLSLRDKHVPVARAVWLLFRHAGFTVLQITKYLFSKDSFWEAAPSEEAAKQFIVEQVRISAKSWETTMRSFAHDHVDPFFYSMLEKKFPPALFAMYVTTLANEKQESKMMAPKEKENDKEPKSKESPHVSMVAVIPQAQSAGDLEQGGSSRAEPQSPVAEKKKFGFPILRSTSHKGSNPFSKKKGQQE